MTPESPSLAGLRLDLVVPVYNERDVVESSLTAIHRHLAEHIPYDWRILVADNGSRDGTAVIVEELSGRMDRVDLLRIDQKGRGRALRFAWLCSRADVVAYMDVDLATRLDAFLPLVRAIAEENYDIAVGRRFGPGATVVGRRLIREITSRGFNKLIQVLFGATVVDMQCGFKAMSRAAADQLLPQVADDEWFFDTELLVRAERAGCAIKTVPVYWTDDPNSHVRIVSDAVKVLRGSIWRLKREGL